MYEYLDIQTEWRIVDMVIGIDELTSNSSFHVYINAMGGMSITIRHGCKGMVAGGDEVLTKWIP